MRVLGVDTSLRCSGYGIVETSGTRFRALACGVVRNPASRPLSACLAALDEAMRALIAEHRPDAVAVEGIFFCKNVRTALILGHARGVVVAAAASAKVPVFEHEPRRVKQAVVGYGAADKSQVGRMVARLLGLATPPEPEDAADALAIALCHAQTSTAHALLAPEPL